jgi:hypothetical protein
VTKRTSVASRQKSQHRPFELDARESKIIEIALLERQGRLLEAVGDTTLSPARRRNAASELLLIATLLGNNETVH